jgi:PhnB protein
MPRVVPMISYEDVGAAADWLCRAFGFRERLRYKASDGRLSHVQLELADGLVMLGNPDGTYVSPKRHAESCEVMRRIYETPYVSDGFHVYVDDVAAHYAQARQAGATVLSGLEETPFGDRHYRVEDPEGHRWMFAEHVRDVAPEDWGAKRAEQR